MRKNVIAASLVLSLAGLTACSAQNTNVKTTTEGTKETSNGDVQVLQMMSVGGADAQAWMDLVEDTIDKFNENNEYNVKIEMTWYENEQYKTKFATLMTQNNMADIFSTWEYGFLEPYVKAGKVYDMTEAFEADPEWKSRFDESVFIPTTFDGHIYGIPSGRQMAPIYYNNHLIDF